MTDDLGLNAYQNLAGRTAQYPGRGGQPIAPYPALGLAGEAGEVCEQIKKALRDDGGQITPERHKALRKELGDVLWYLAAIAFELDLNLSDIAQANLDKLADRKERGVLKGSGDER